MTLGKILHLGFFGTIKVLQELAVVGAPPTQRCGVEYSPSLGWTWSTEGHPQHMHCMRPSDSCLQTSRRKPCSQGSPRYSIPAISALHCPSPNQVWILAPAPRLVTWGLPTALYKNTVQNKKKSSSKLWLI